MTVILAHAIPATENVRIQAISVDSAALLDTKAAAKLLSLSEIYLKALRSHGHGPAFARFGRAIRYRLSDLDAWIEEHRIEPIRYAAAANKPASRANTFASRAHG